MTRHLLLVAALATFSICNAQLPELRTIIEPVIENPQSPEIEVPESVTLPDIITEEPGASTPDPAVDNDGTGQTGEYIPVLMLEQFAHQLSLGNSFNPVIAIFAGRTDELRVEECDYRFHFRKNALKVCANYFSERKYGASAGYERYIPLDKKQQFSILTGISLTAKAFVRDAFEIGGPEEKVHFLGLGPAIGLHLYITERFSFTTAYNISFGRERVIKENGETVYNPAIWTWFDNNILGVMVSFHFGRQRSYTVGETIGNMGM